jgi:protocatechuate 4,5-dioxygenase alpha subunit
MSKEHPWEDGGEILAIQSGQIDYSKPLPGTYLTTGIRAQRGYRLGKFCMTLMAPANRDLFKADAEKYMSDFGLSDYEKELVRSKNWNRMLRYGVNTFMILKLSNAMGVSQNHTGAAMRNQSYEDFMATRNSKGAQ